jgi:hypothetical protein
MFTRMAIRLHIPDDLGFANEKSTLCENHPAGINTGKRKRGKRIGKKRNY